MTKHWQLQVLGLESCTQGGPSARSPVGTEAIGSLWEQMDEDSGQGRDWWWRREGKNIKLGYKSGWNEV